MKYRKFGKLDWQVSALGFGCMRLPTLGEHAKIDEPEATRMLYHAIDHGVNYVDTAYGYHGGNSELFLGRALRGTYRDKVRLATKLPPWHVKEVADFDRLFNEQLGKLQTERLDFYLLHSLDAQSWHKLRDLGVREWAAKEIKRGRIGHLGFSFHDNYEAFQEIIDDHDGWTFCQIQYNYMDIENQAGTKGLQYAAAKGLAVVVMEPLLGGRLARPPQAVREIWDSAPGQCSPAGWAFRWLWSQPEVSVTLSGMNTMAQVQENLALADQYGNAKLSAAEMALVDRVRETYRNLVPIPCTRCEYCMPCPNGVNIPGNFAMLNEGVMYDELENSRKRYARTKEEERASACIQCQRCEELCPQHIKISEWMPRVHEILGEGKPLSQVE